MTALGYPLRVRLVAYCMIGVAVLAFVLIAPLGLALLLHQNWKDARHA